jgi:N-acetylmuramic acid 6-phosphate etherase
MKKHSSKQKPTSCFLGIEGGATRTTAVCLSATGEIIGRNTGGPCNLRLNSDSDILRVLKNIKRSFGAEPVAVGTFLAGCRTRTDKLRMLRLLRKIWPQTRLTAGSDTLSAFEAALHDRDGMMIICGTGSIVRARRRGKAYQVGGWGHIGGDDGSGYWLGRRLLRTIFLAYDENGESDAITQSVLRFVNINTIDELVRWSMDANKFEIASLTKPLFLHHQHPSIRRILQEGCDLLAEQAFAAAKKSGFLKMKSFPVAINPGLAKHQPLFFQILKRTVKRALPNAEVILSDTEGAVGAARLALKAAAVGAQRNHRNHDAKANNSTPHAVSPERQLSVALTEQRNPRTMDLDRRSIPSLVQTMLNEETRTIPAIRTQSKSIARAIEWIVSSFKKKGRLFYIGAGTSGRVGVLDASECPPTYGVDPEMVQGIMAGGYKALYQSMEAVEDDANYGRATVRDRGITAKDVLVGIAASGSTPFVLGALEEANARGAKTILLTFNPSSRFQIPNSRFLKIAIPTGPEVVTGSTRLKAGTATKLVLNMLTTISMIRLGKIRSNLMIDLEPSCLKLHDRAARIYSALKKVPYEDAVSKLEAHQWNLKKLL